MNPDIAGRRSLASSSAIPKELPGDEDGDVLFGTKYGVRTIELNRPKKLNSLNGSMARKIVPRLKEWEKSQLANVIVIKGAGRAFCAGGDVAALALENKTGKEGQQASKDYFALEYKLDHLIATYPKPYVAFMDGITMGGGVGLSVHAPFRIATEKTAFAMPETTIGFFPDVGASFFLPRMDGGVGTYLALTSEQLKGVNVFYAGIATHYIHSSSLPDLEARLAELNFKDYATLDDRLRIIDQTIEEFTTGIPHDVPMQLSGNIRRAIDYCFQPSFDAETILAKLDEMALAAQAEGAEPALQKITEWISQTKETILSRSPVSVKVAIRQLREGRKWNIMQTFQHEHHIASRFMEHPDFIEGVEAKLVRKEKPTWSLPRLEDVTDEMVDEFFTSEPNGLELLNVGKGAAYQDYPFAWIGLPREADVEKVLREGGPGMDAESIINRFLMEKGGKMGVREKIEEILQRQTVVEGGRMVWI